MSTQTKAQLYAARLEAIFISEEVNANEAAAIAAELRRLDAFRAAYNEWHTKTEWVQESANPGEFGLHRADILRLRIEALATKNAQLLKALGEIEWSNNSQWQADRARAAIATAKGQV